MSVKHRIKDRLPDGTINSLYNRPHSWDNRYKIKHNLYNSCPRWWNKLYHIKPLRRNNHYLCYQLKHNPAVADGIAYPLPHKPHEYYW